MNTPIRKSELLAGYVFATSFNNHSIFNDIQGDFPRVSHSKKVYKPRQDASYVSHSLTSVYHHLHSNPPLQSRSEPAPSIRHLLLRVHLQGFDNRHLHAGFARCGPRRAAQGNGTKLLTRLTGTWLTSLAMKCQGNYVVSFSVYVGCCVEVEVRTGRV